MTAYARLRAYGLCKPLLLRNMRLVRYVAAIASQYAALFIFGLCALARIRPLCPAVASRYAGRRLHLFAL